MLGTIKDILNAGHGWYYERVRSPIFGTFVVCWLTVNWRIPAVLLMSKMSIQDTLIYLDSEIMNPFRLYAYPFVATILILGIFPWMSYWYYKYWRQAETLKRIKQLELKTVIASNVAILAVHEGRIEEARDKVKFQREQQKIQLEIEMDKKKRDEEIAREDAIENRQRQEKIMDQQTKDANERRNVEMQDRIDEQKLRKRIARDDAITERERNEKTADKRLEMEHAENLKQMELDHQLKIENIRNNLS